MGLRRLVDGMLCSYHSWSRIILGPVTAGGDIRSNDAKTFAFHAVHIDLAACQFTDMLLVIVDDCGSCYQLLEQPRELNLNVSGLLPIETRLAFQARRQDAGRPEISSFDVMPGTSPMKMGRNSASAAQKRGSEA